MKITALSASCTFDPGFTVVAHVSGGAVELYTRGPDGQISTPERLPDHWQPWGTGASVAAAVAAGNLEPLRQAVQARGEAEQIRRGWRDAPAAPPPDKITLAPAPTPRTWSATQTVPAETLDFEHHAARAFFASAWADARDGAGESCPGEIMDQMPPELDPAAIHAARTLRMDLERANKSTVPDMLGTIAEHACGDRDPTPEYFGHYAAMQAMGHGVGLGDAFGSHVRELISVPYCEFGSYSLERDYFPEATDDAH